MTYGKSRPAGLIGATAQRTVRSVNEPVAWLARPVRVVVEGLPLQLLLEECPLGDVSVREH